MHPMKGFHRGITLIEQIMALAIIAVLATVALPPLNHLLHRNRLKTAQIDYIAGLRQARAAAVHRGIPTVFCPSIDGQRCDEKRVWDAGWLTAADIDRDNQPDAQPMYRWASADHGVMVRSSAGRNHVRFQPDGSAPGSNLTLRFCIPEEPGRVLSVIVSNSGRIRASSDNNSEDDCTTPEA